MGVPQNIMCALCAVIRPDHFKFASYGPELLQYSKLQMAKTVVKTVVTASFVCEYNV